MDIETKQIISSSDVPKYLNGLKERGSKKLTTASKINLVTEDFEMEKEVFSEPFDDIMSKYS